MMVIPTVRGFSQTHSQQASQLDEVKIQYIKASSDYEYGEKAGRMYTGMIKLSSSILPDQLAKMGIPSPHVRPAPLPHQPR
jgi:hypothetical protein